MQTTRTRSLTWAIWALAGAVLQANAAPANAEPARARIPAADAPTTAAKPPTAAKPTTPFDDGLAQIRKGRLSQGVKLVEPAIREALAANDFANAERLLRQYADALEQSGFLVAALEISHRYDEVRKSRLTTDHQRAISKLSTRFDEERRDRELALQRSENALQSAQTEIRHLRQKFARAGVVFIACLCGLILWTLVRVRKTRARLRLNDEHDALTGLQNRRYFNEHVLAKEGARPAAGCVMLADLDHFKRINETLGHPAGDAVLAAVAKRLTAALGGTGTLVRWGGEEFFAELGPMTEAEAGVKAQTLLRAVREAPVMWKDDAIQCTMSIGFACFPMAGAVTGISLDSAISLVDKALYEAKQRGRDRACMIRYVQARNELDLTMIEADFQSAAADRRIQLAEILGAAA